jgi:hypothetical protein
LASSSLNKETKERELKKYLDLNLATLDYFIEYPGMKIKTVDFDSDIYFKSLKDQALENYEKGRLTKLKQWFRELTEGASDDPGFRQYLKKRTGQDIDLRGQFEKRIETIKKNGIIKNENQFRDIMEKMNDVSDQMDKKEIELFNSLLLDYENRQRSKRK